LAIYKIGLVVFASPEKEMLGVLTVRDIVLALHEEGQAVPETKISKVMTRGVWACTPEDRLANITQVMTENKMCHSLRFYSRSIKIAGRGGFLNCSRPLKLWLLHFLFDQTSSSFYQQQPQSTCLHYQHGRL
jgi:CBS domain-containing protein